jgi:hypothetical protein
MLDLQQAEKLVAQLQKAEDRAHQPIDPALPIALARVRLQTERAFDGMKTDDLWFSDASSIGLVGAGLGLVARWFKGS